MSSFYFAVLYSQATINNAAFDLASEAVSTI